MTSKQHKTPTSMLDEGELKELLGYLLAQASVVTIENFHRKVGKPLGLGKVEVTILPLIKQNASVTPSRLASALGISKPAVTVRIDRLEQRGLLQRQQNPEDLRSQHFCVTPEGAALAASAITTLVEADIQTMKHLSPAERAMLFELLVKVARR